MTVPNPQSDHRKWQGRYSAGENRWEDLRRSGRFITPIVLLIVLAIFYALFGFTFLRMESWAPPGPSPLSQSLFTLRVLIVVFAPLLALLAGLIFIFKQSAAFTASLYRPKEGEKLRPLIQRRLLGIPPVPPPLGALVHYPFVLLQEPVLAEDHWARWLGGPAILVIYDGVAVYLERGNQFSRVVGPGMPMPFLDRYERIKEIIDLRPQTKIDKVLPWTKDGIRITLTIRAECQIDACPEAVKQSSHLRFPFDPLAVKTAVERMTVKINRAGELFECSWLEGAWGTITGLINAYVAGHTLDELFLAPQTKGSTPSGTSDKDPSKEIEQILSQKVRGELDKARKSLAQNGVKVLSIQITKVEVPAQVLELRARYWETAKQQIAALRNSRAEADRIRIRERAHAEAQRTMLKAITQQLEKVDEKNLTEPLLVSLSGILDQGLEDPIVRPLIAKESFAVLDRVRKMLKEGF